MMKKNLLLLPLLFSAGSIAAPEDCAPNRENIDVCAAARQIANNIYPQLPLELNEFTVLTDIQARQRRVVLTDSKSYNQDELKLVTHEDDTRFKNLNVNQREMLGQYFCSHKDIRHFIELGGEFELNSYFGDDITVEKIVIQSCQ